MKIFVLWSFSNQISLAILKKTDEINALIKSVSEKFFTSFHTTRSPLDFWNLPACMEADIAVAEGQPLGISLNFGGPYLVFFQRTGEHQENARKNIGKQMDPEGREGYVLTMQTREQHIKRERATSNICTNEGLDDSCSPHIPMLHGKRRTNRKFASQV